MAPREMGSVMMLGKKAAGKPFARTLRFSRESDHSFLSGPVSPMGSYDQGLAGRRELAWLLLSPDWVWEIIAWFRCNNRTCRNVHETHHSLFPLNRG